MVRLLFCIIATLWFLVLLGFGMGIIIHGMRGLRRSVSSAARMAADQGKLESKRPIKPLQHNNYYVASEGPSTVQ